MHRPSEPPQDCRRLQLFRDWSHDERIKDATFSPEVRERAVRKVLDQRIEHASLWAAIVSNAAKFGGGDVAPVDKPSSPGKPHHISVCPVVSLARTGPLRRPPWNKGKLVGAKPPLRPSHVWSIRTKLQIEGKRRDLALFNLAIDSKLHGCDVVAVRVDDVAPNGYTMDRATVRQKKTGRPVRFELTDQARQEIDEYLRLTGRKAGQFLFAGCGNGDRGLTTRQYARLVQE